MAVAQAERLGLQNFSVLVSHVLVPPAMTAVLNSPRNLVQGFLAAGHVCAVMGTAEYQPIVDQFHIPIVVTGFEPLDILQGVFMCVKQLEQGRADLENQYSRIVRPEGNPAAKELVGRVFSTINRKWRGIGEIPDSGWGLSEQYARFDANLRFAVEHIKTNEPEECIAGEVLQGHRKPFDCPAFGVQCTPERPLGAPMVSAEGACAAYYRYRRQQAAAAAKP
jgi:hydrogenase expression/formation protein HypD